MRSMLFPWMDPSRERRLVNAVSSSVVGGRRHTRDPECGFSTLTASDVSPLRRAKEQAPFQLRAAKVQDTHALCTKLREPAKIRTLAFRYDFRCRRASPCVAVRMTCLEAHVQCTSSAAVPHKLRKSNAQPRRCRHSFS